MKVDGHGAKGLASPAPSWVPPCWAHMLCCSGLSVRHLVQLSCVIGVMKSPLSLCGHAWEKTDQCSHECALSGGCVQAG